MGDYRARMLDVHGPDSFPKIRAPQPGKDALPRTTLVDNTSAPNPDQAVVDMSKDDDAESTDPEDSGSSTSRTSSDEEDKANTTVPFIPQMETSHPQTEMSILPNNTEAVGFGSDYLATQSGDNEELSQAEPN